MRKPAFCICENIGADQLRGNHEADRRLCFSTMALLHKSEISSLAILCGCTARFVSDLVGNPKVRFCHDELNAGSSAIATLIFVAIEIFALQMCMMHLTMHVH